MAEDKTTQDVDRILEIARHFHRQFQNSEVPEIEIPTRTKNNIELDESMGVWKYGDSTSTRSAKSIRGAYRLLKMLYTIDFFKTQLEEERSSTLRELYYISENWENAKFREQSESDKLIEDLEIVTDMKREDFHIRPEEDGATIIGPLTIEEKTKRGERKIHCQYDVGEGGYQIPNNPDNVKFKDHDADFVIAIETGGMRDRLIENGFDEKYNAIVVHLKGQPARSTRRITKRLNEELGLPVTVFTDADPWSYRIFSSVAYGSIKSAHLSEYMATPNAEFIGVCPTDIVEYELPTDSLNDQDIKALESELTDPRFNTPFWKKEIELQLELEKKSEQQSLAKYGLDYVTETYLPEKLKEKNII
ncbi:DNA topoisomerase IV subunit A [Methanonatronarchaeum sp. AMET6-2]|uniref:DNA topoisomerase IV subunit A n=1 Tax=Methanonatronarchaeum sp. AMET6-2 TaxID=2933293 RepID=UPI00121B3184|nr:DNA topoisomerase IV subunit A [Methanonatronarchaeum sp. AMET6-2]RZN61620.1 MAG: DNA topoisomerase IV subunit A [Methanonatronarchaeia archaeon]UOY10323.1 DNA topoisomerase IV subunit A [Methanonatronarchaeum sp. AMET6-2]